MLTLKKIIKVGLFSVLFLPLLFTPFTFFPWHFGRTIVFQIIVEIILLLYLCARLAGWREAAAASWLKRLNAIDWSVIFFLLVLLLTALTGVNFSNSFWGNQARANGVFTWLHFGVFYFLLIHFLRDRKEWYSLIGFGLVVSSFVSLTAIFPNAFLPISWQSASGGGIIGNRAFLASYLLIALGLSAYLFFTIRGQWKWLAAGVGAIDLVALFLTGNRGGLLGLLAGLLGGLIAALLMAKERGRQLLVGGLLFGLLAVVGLVFLSNKDAAGALGLSNNLAQWSASGTGATRLMAWNIAWQGIKERPLAGWGMGNYEIIFSKYFNPQLLKYGFTETVWDKPHNWLLEIGDSAGLLGMIGYLAMTCFACGYLFRDSQKKDNAIWRGVVLLATLLAYFVQGLFLFETANSLILWFVLLAFISSSVHQAGVAVQGPAPTHSSARQTGNLVYNILRCAVLIALLFSLVRFNYIPLRSSYYMRQAETSDNLQDWLVHARRALSIPVPWLSENAVFLAQQFTKFDKANALDNSQKTADTALGIVGVLKTSARKYPDNLSFPVWAGQVFMVLGERFDAEYYADAEAVLLKARGIAPAKQEVLFLLGRLYLLKEDFGAAVEAQEKAVELAPDIHTSHWFLGLTYVAADRAEEGLAEIEKAMEMGYNPSKEQKLYLIDLYAGQKRYGKVIEMYRAFLDAEPENVNWYIKLAAAYALAGDKTAALNLARQAMALYPPVKEEAEKFIKQYQLE